METSEQGNGRISTVVQQNVSVMVVREESGLVINGREKLWIQEQV